jgi:sarcosine oxidase, subunit delta
VLQINCPWCGLRDEIEFTPRDEVIERPDPMTATDDIWTAYLYERGNTCGWLREYWLHVHGCGQLFIVRRHSMTQEIE